MNEPIERGCRMSGHIDAGIPATGRVRYVDGYGVGRLSVPMCDACQAQECDRLRPRERSGQIREVGAVPLDYLERMDEARRVGAVRRIADEIKGAPGTQDEIADMIVSALDALPRDTRHCAMKSAVFGRLQRWAAEQDEASARLDLNLADSPSALAREIARFLLELDDRHVPGIAGAVRARIQTRENERQVEALRRAEDAPGLTCGARPNASSPDVCEMGRDHSGTHYAQGFGVWK